MMAENDLDYHIDEDLEQLFHRELQNLELGHQETNHDDVIGDHLPEWLVGVIVVIAMLIVAFFVMIITSLIKNRKKHRSSTYIGSPTTCDDLESGKIGHSDDSNMKMTSFSSVPDTLHETSRSPQAVSDSEDHDVLTPGGGDCVNGVLGCKNPLFVDDDPDSDDIISEENDVKNGTDEIKEKKQINSSSSDVSIPSTSSGYRGSDMLDHGKSKGTPHKYKSSSGAKKSTMAIKTEVHEGDKMSDVDVDVRKRMFMSKTKSGHQTSNKREKTKETSSDNVIISRGDESFKSEGTGEVSKTDCDASPEITSDSNFQRKSTCVTCEDSGVELSSPESHLKEETGGSSESDDFGSNVDTKASHEIIMECSDGQETDMFHSGNNKCTKTNSSHSVFLANRTASPTSCDSFQTVVCSQNSSIGNSTEIIEMNITIVTERKDIDILDKTSELLQLKCEEEESIKTRERATHSEQNKNTNMLAIGVLCEETESLSSGYSDTKSHDEVGKIASVDNDILINPSPATSSRSNSPADVATTKPLNRKESQDMTELDRVLSTNL